MHIYILFLSILPTLPGLRVIKSGIAPGSTCRTGLEFSVMLDNMDDDDFHVELIPDECCLKTGEGVDCDVLQIIGECFGVIPRGSAKTLTLVAPIISPFERQGSCTIHVDARPIDRTRAIKRETLKLHFDTTVKERDKKENVIQYKHRDEDPENNCKPVNCETYYNGRRYFFDKRTKRCTNTPYAIDKNINNGIEIYDPIKNKFDEFSVSNDNIDYIKATNDKMHTKDILVIESEDKTINQSKPKYTSIDNDPELIADFHHNVSTPKLIQIRTKIYAQTLIKSLFSNKYTVMILVLIIILQCSLIMFMVYCLTNSSSCCSKNKVVTRFFSYRQDASVTTPLIGTSNMDTETTEFDYISETSNIDNKIKCYKACQKERMNNAKISMSDDILSKCLARRDWSSKPRSDTVADPTSVIHFEFKIPTKECVKENKTNEEQNKELVAQNIETINQIDCQCNIDIKSTTESQKIDIQIPEKNPGSEREIQCLNYNLAQSPPNFKSTDNLHGKSVSAGKSAQVCFSNDSLDDFLSERGIIFRENASRTSFDSSSTETSSTELTSKPSKNNIIKNVLSFLTKSKTTASDPGSKSKRKQLELIHLSKATFSSSTDNAKVTKSRFFGSGTSQVSK